MKNLLNKVAPLVLFVFVLLGCNAVDQIKQKVEEVAQPQKMTATDGSCEITVPAGWHTATDLNDEAIIQASHLVDDIHVVVIRETREDFKDGFSLDDYTKLLRTDVEGKIQKTQFSEPVTTTINSMEAREFDATGEIENMKVKFKYAIIKTPDSYFQVLLSSTPSVFQKHQADVISVIQSFKPMDAAPAPAANKGGKKL